MKLVKLKEKINFISLSIALVVLMFVYSWYYIFVIDGASLASIFSEKNLEHTRKFIDGLLGKSQEYPAFLDTDEWKNIIILSYETLVMSILAVAIASIGALFTVVFGARNIMDGSLIPNKKWYRIPLFVLVRSLYVVTRAVPELIWAMVVIFIFRPGIIPGAIALAIHNFGILGKLCSEVIENIDSSPIDNLHSSGASNAQILFYGIFPMVLSSFMTYIVYRWEVIIRTTIVVGFIGAGGLGKQFRLSMSSFNYSQLTVILIAYMALVFLADLISNFTRYLSD